MKQLDLLVQHIAEIKLLMLVTGEAQYHANAATPEWVKLARKKQYKAIGNALRTGSPYVWEFKLHESFKKLIEYSSKEFGYIQQPMFIEHIRHKTT